MVALAPANSQTVGDNALQEASLDIPGGQFLYKRNDPNVRRATAVVNGEIITGTDIDQRIMLLTNGDISQVPAEQRTSFESKFWASWSTNRSAFRKPKLTSSK